MNQLISKRLDWPAQKEHFDQANFALNYRPNRWGLRSIMPKTSDMRQIRRSVETAGSIHPWPSQAGECNEDAWEIYVSLQDYRSFDDWPKADLIELARLIRMIENAIDLQALLDDQGYVVLGGKSGTTRIENPAGRALSTLNSSIASLKRILGLLETGLAEKRARANRGQQSRRAASQIGGGYTDRDFDGALLMEDDDEDEQFDRTRLM